MSMEYHQLTKGIRDLRNLSLPSEEKQAVLARLLERIDAHRAHEFPTRPQLVPSPYQALFTTRHLQYVVATLVAFVIVGGASSQAAQSALPGDLLYPLKIHVNEAVRGAFIAGDIPKAEWETTKIVLRLEEAETLASEGRLTEATANAISQNVEASMNGFSTLVQRSASSTPADEVLNAHVNLEAQVQAHAQILAALEQEVPPPEQSDVAALRAVVTATAKKAREERSSAAQAFMYVLPVSQTATSTGQAYKPRHSTATSTDSSIVHESGAVLSHSDESTTTEEVISSALVQTEGKQPTDYFDDKERTIQALITETEGQLRSVASTTITSSHIQRSIVGQVPSTLQSARDSLERAREQHESGDALSALSALLDSESSAKEANISLKQSAELTAHYENRSSEESHD